MANIKPDASRTGNRGQQQTAEQMMAKRTGRKSRNKQTGRLRIGNDWNAINVIALSQSNPLKAIAEFVENSIDAQAKKVVIVRGRRKGETYLRLIDDGIGIRKDEDGIPDFKFVATHICDSIKRHQKENGQTALQGEFGIGLLSFWTVGEQLVLASAGDDGKIYEMRMEKGSPNYDIVTSRRLLAESGTELTVWKLLPGLRTLHGEKLQRYLASELRDRIRNYQIEISIHDKVAGKRLRVEPQKFEGRPIRHLESVASRRGEIQLELYLADATQASSVALFRSGTRVVQSLADIEYFRRSPWNSRFLQGLIDAPFLTLTPGTRTGIVHDTAFQDFCDALVPVEQSLVELLDQQEKAAEQEASLQTLKAIRRAFREAFSMLPEDEYSWFDMRSLRTSRGTTSRSGHSHDEAGEPEAGEDVLTGESADSTPLQQQKSFFEHAGPLASVKMSPAKATIPIRSDKSFRAICKDRKGQAIEDGLTFRWSVVEGGGALAAADEQIVTFTSLGEPAIVRLQVSVTQDDETLTAEARITVTESLLTETRETPYDQKGLPRYTYQNLPAELWRSRYDQEQNLVIINSGHSDFAYASDQKARQLRYICRLFAKEMVYHNFRGISSDQLLERMIELSLYTEEHLR